MENYCIHTLSYFSERFLSIHKNLFTYQWRHLWAFGKKIRDSHFLLRSEEILSTPGWLLDPQSHHPRWLHNLYIDGLAVSFTSFCGFQGENERERVFFSTRTLHSWVILCICENVFKARALFLLSAHICGCREKWQDPMQGQNTSTSRLLFFLCMHNLLQIFQWIVTLYPDKWKAQCCGYQRNTLLDWTHHSLQSSITACWASLSFPQETRSWHQ